MLQPPGKINCRDFPVLPGSCLGRGGQGGEEPCWAQLHRPPPLPCGAAEVGEIRSDVSNIGSRTSGMWARSGVVEYSPSLGTWYYVL